MTERSIVVRMLKWDTLPSDTTVTSRAEVSRTKILGGWLVRLHNSHITTDSITFVPDPEHQWDGSSLP